MLSTLRAHLYLGSRVSSLLLSINQGAKVSTVMKGSNKKEVKISVSHISIFAILPPPPTLFPIINLLLILKCVLLQAVLLYKNGLHNLDTKRLTLTEV